MPEGQPTPPGVDILPSGSPYATGQFGAMVDNGYPTDQALGSAQACDATQIAAQDIYSGPPAPGPLIDQTPDYGSD
eukprot:5103462-Prymnesium_polylepis.1